MRSLAPLSLALVLLAIPRLSAAESRAGVPSADAQAEAEKLIKDVFQEEYARNGRSDRLALAVTLLKQAPDTREDLAARFVLFREARDLAGEAGDLELAFRAAEELAGCYAISGTTQKAHLLAQAWGRRPAEEPSSLLLETTLKVLGEALEGDDFPTADRLAELGKTAVEMAAPPPLRKTYQAQAHRIDALRAEHHRVRASLATLANFPDDPAANRAVGRYLCFWKGSWAQGLHLLARGDNESLARLARADLDRPSRAAEQLPLADSWLEMAAEQPEPARNQVRRRALHWYVHALPELGGLTRTRVERRAAELEELTDGVADPDGWLAVFRSSDPAIWNSNVRKSWDNQAVELSRVPANVRFLKLTNCRTNGFVVLAISNDRLARASADGPYGWEGTNSFQYRGYHLGIFHKEWTSKDKGAICIGFSPESQGWGLPSGLKATLRPLVGARVPVTLPLPTSHRKMLPFG